MTVLPLRPRVAPRHREARLRVLFLIDSLGPGGAEHLLDAYLGHLPQLGVDPVVGVMHEREGNPIAARIRGRGIPVRLVGIRRLRQPSALPRVLGLVREVDPAVIHTQLEAANVFGTVAAHLRGIPSVATLHTLEEPVRGTRDARRFRLMAHILRRYAARIFAVSDGARRHHIERSGFPPERTMTLHNGIDLPEFLYPPSGTRERIRAELGVEGDAPLAITVAVLREPKGIQDLIAAIPAISAAVPAHRLAIVGDGPHRPELERLAEPLGGRVLFTGARRDVAALLAAADLFVLPSLTEALPTAIAEAMAAGLPVVATNVGGVPEMVEHGITGLLVPPARPDLLADGVTSIMGRPRQARAMGIAGRRRAVESFDITRRAADLVEEYRYLAHRAGTRREPRHG